MPRSKEQFEAMRLATREKIQTAAVALFARKGLAGTSVQEIADAAGISIGLLYRHYKTKEELFDEMVDMARVGLKEVSEIFTSGKEARAIILDLSSEVIADLSGEDNVFSNFIMVITQAISSGLENDTLAGLVEQDRLLLLALTNLVAKGQKEGSFRQGAPQDLALAFMSALQGISQFKMLFGEDFKAPAPESLAGILIL